jgi:hypothetical protein
LKLGEALNRIVAADPRYSWEESEGRIIVRALDSRSPLQLRLAPVVLDRATLAGTVDTLMRALDPDRVLGGIVRGGLRAQLSLGPEGTPRLNEGPEVAISLSLNRPTLLEALTAIVNQRGDLSWVVRQDEKADVEGVGLTLSLPSASATALPDRMVRTARERASSPSGPARVTVPLTLGIRSALTAYGKRAKVRIGLELVPASQDEPRPTGGGMLDLTGVEPPEALTRIVRADSRYMWVDAAGVIDVQPALHLREPGPLDRPIDGLNAQGQPVDTILDRIVALLGGQGRSGVGDSWGSMPGSPERLKAEAARGRPITLQVGPTTVRELLNTLCRTQGTLSWTVTPILRKDGLMLVSLQVDSWEDWGISRSFTLSKW